MKYSDVFSKRQRWKSLSSAAKNNRAKKTIFILKSLNKGNKISLKLSDIIRKTTKNLNKTPSEKYGIELGRA